jgi:hypothetical protein
MPNFLRSRWRGEVPLSIVLWRDMILVGTALNIMTGMAAIVLLASGASAALALAVHFALAPWNVFLFLVTWRVSEKISLPEALIARAIAIIWLVVVVVV